MTNNEFKAWFEGFSEGVSWTPTREQWEKVVAKVKMIDNMPLFPQIVYRDRWLPTYPGYYSAGSTMGSAQAAMNTAIKLQGSSAVEDQRETLYNLGKMESQTL
jgi:hypothetical protein